MSPHLPPDQAANALLPALLGEWAPERGHQVTFLTHDPAQAGTLFPATDGKKSPGMVWRVPRRDRATGVARLLRVDTLAQARVIGAARGYAARAAARLHLHSNGLIIEVAAAWAVRHRVPYVLTLYGTEIWHFRRRAVVDPFARAYTPARVVTF